MRHEEQFTTYKSWRSAAPTSRSTKRRSHAASVSQLALGAALVRLPQQATSPKTAVSHASWLTALARPGRLASGCWSRRIRAYASSQYPQETLESTTRSSLLAGASCPGCFLIWHRVAAGRSFFADKVSCDTRDAKASNTPSTRPHRYLILLRARLAEG